MNKTYLVAPLFLAAGAIFRMPFGIGQKGKVFNNGYVYRFRNSDKTPADVKMQVADILKATGMKIDEVILSKEQADKVQEACTVLRIPISNILWSRTRMTNMDTGEEFDTSFSGKVGISYDVTAKKTGTYTDKNGNVQDSLELVILPAEDKAEDNKEENAEVNANMTIGEETNP